jgi:hypothetical protein
VKSFVSPLALLPPHLEGARVGSTGSGGPGAPLADALAPVAFTQHAQELGQTEEEGVTPEA